MPVATAKKTSGKSAGSAAKGAKPRAGTKRKSPGSSLAKRPAKKARSTKAEAKKGVAAKRSVKKPLGPSYQERIRDAFLEFQGSGIMWVGQQKVRELVQNKYPHFRPKIFRDTLQRMIASGDLTRLPSKYHVRRKFHLNKTPLAKRQAASERAAAKIMAKKLSKGTGASLAASSAAAAAATEDDRESEDEDEDEDETEEEAEGEAAVTDEEGDEEEDGDDEDANEDE